MKTLIKERLNRGIELLEERGLTLLYSLSTEYFTNYLISGDENEINKIQKGVETNDCI